MKVHKGQACHLWLLAVGFSVWACALAAAYVLHSVGCTFGWSTDTLRWSLALAILIHLALIGALWRTFARRFPTPPLSQTDSFMRWVIMGTLIAAFITIVFTLGPALFLTTCT